MFSLKNDYFILWSDNFPLSLLKMVKKTVMLYPPPHITLNNIHAGFELIICVACKSYPRPCSCYTLCPHSSLTQANYRSSGL